MPFSNITEKQLGGLLVQVIDGAPVMLMAKAAGFDFVLFDGEHGDLDETSLSACMILGNQIGLPAIMRVPELSRSRVSRALDLGAKGVMVPMMETSEQAQKLVSWAKYPPLGLRSYSGGAHTAYGTSGHHEERMQAANTSTLAIAQIESVKAVENVEAIMAVDGIDAAVIGPCDLAISMGKPDEVGCAEELSLIDRVRDACTATHKGFGIIGSNAMISRYANSINLMTSAIDVHILRDSFAVAVADYDSIRNSNKQG